MTAPTIAERLAALEARMRKFDEPTLPVTEWATAEQGDIRAWADELAAIRALLTAETAPSITREHVWHPDYDEEQGRVVESCFNCGVSRECWPLAHLAPEEP